MNQAEVTETNEAPSQEAPAVEGAQEQEKSLDQLLSEYETPIEEPKQEVEAPKPAQDDSRLAQIESYIAQQQQKDMNNGLVESAEFLKKEIGGDLPISVYRGMLFDKASADDRYKEAFQQRFQSPEKWNQLLRGVAKEFKEEMSIDTKSTESWNAVEASVRSSQTTAPKDDPQVTEKDLRKMTDQEFADFKKKLGFR